MSFLTRQSGDTLLIPNGYFPRLTGSYHFDTSLFKESLKFKKLILFFLNLVFNNGLWPHFGEYRLQTTKEAVKG